MLSQIDAPLESNLYWWLIRSLLSLKNPDPLKIHTKIHKNLWETNQILLESKCPLSNEKSTLENHGMHFAFIITLINLTWLSSWSRRKHSFLGNQRPFLLDLSRISHEYSRKDPNQHRLYSGTIRLTGKIFTWYIPVPYERDGWMAKRTDGTQIKFLLSKWP